MLLSEIVADWAIPTAEQNIPAFNLTKKLVLFVMSQMMEGVPGLIRSIEHFYCATGTRVIWHGHHSNLRERLANLRLCDTELARDRARFDARFEGCAHRADTSGSQRLQIRLRQLGRRREHSGGLSRLSRIWC